jgi:hypothetical protein
LGKIQAKIAGAKEKYLRIYMLDDERKIMGTSKRMEDQSTLSYKEVDIGEINPSIGPDILHKHDMVPQQVDK